MSPISRNPPKPIDSQGRSVASWSMTRVASWDIIRVRVVGSRVRDWFLSGGRDFLVWHQPLLRSVTSFSLVLPPRSSSPFFHSIPSLSILSPLLYLHPLHSFPSHLLSSTISFSFPLVIFTVFPSTFPSSFHSIYYYCYRYSGGVLGTAIISRPPLPKGQYLGQKKNQYSSRKNRLELHGLSCLQPRNKDTFWDFGLCTGLHYQRGAQNPLK